jgi:type VI protein secretion system component VasK
MSFKASMGDEPAEESRPSNPGAGETGDLALEQALKDFRMSVHAWSEAAYSRPRTAGQTVRHRSWRLAAGWALGLALMAGGVSGTVYQRHHRQELARIAARAAEQQRLASERQAREEEEDLLAKVDKDVSREVPNAMEPLAQLMTAGGQ